MVAIHKVVGKAQFQGIHDADGMILVGVGEQFDAFGGFVHLPRSVPYHDDFLDEAVPFGLFEHFLNLLEGHAEAIGIVGHKDDGKLGFGTFVVGGQNALPLFVDGFVFWVLLLLLSLLFFPLFNRSDDAKGG